ncbi:MAG: pentapeptide repeat-containing protein [Lachnospiraceae bacterium]|nr:pentapeptide repeat-containing protein [Lachnospiraceae bacterium]
MKLQKPTLPALFEVPDMEPGLLLSKAAEAEEELENFHIANAFLPDMDLSGQRFSGMFFENCRLPAGLFNRASFVDVRFKGCDFSNCFFEEAYFNRCEWISCKWVGASFEGASFRQTEIVSSNLQYCNLDHSLWDYARMKDCDLSQAYLSNCRLKKAELENCRLVRTSIHRTPLRGMDLTSCELGGLILSENFSELKGALVRADQALELSRLLGIVIQ